ncbi:DUF3823 domain-containing protein, partial [Bacteroides cellulosilyticus]
IQQEIGTSGDAACVQVREYGYAIRKVQQWKLMLNGEYRNNLVFSGTYDVIMNNGNFVKLDTIKGYRFDKGENKTGILTKNEVEGKFGKTRFKGTAKPSLVK